LHERIGVFVPLILIDSAALGAALINIRHAHGLFGSLFQGVGAAAGFGLVIIALAAMQERLQVAEIPAPFRGLAITLITLGIMSMAFMGFNGITGG
jgi:electron transport complex protein RnfA